MSQPNIKKNILLSTAYQILTMITPLITTPYVSRVLGASGVGIYSYTTSIETYFSMFAALGTVSYGAREIARHRNDRRERSRLFWEIELLTVLTTAVCLIVWGIWTVTNVEYRIYYAVLTFYLLATMFDISWFYTGIEQFQYIVTQNTIFKLLSVAALFVLVKDKNDVAIYIAVISLSMLLGNISMWFYLPKFVEKIEWKNLHIKPHFHETLIYFIPTIATSVYTVLDRTLIGLITHDESENGYYEQATKIINMCKAITFSALNSVLGARISYLYAQEKYDEIRDCIHQSIDYILFMGLGMCFGLIGVAHKFVPIFFGAGYDETIVLLQMLSPLVIIIGISNCLGSQYYTPAGLRKQSALYIIAGSCVNLVLNLALIPHFKSRGAVAATLVAETVIAVLYLRKCEDVLTLSDIWKRTWKKLIAAFLMIGMVWLIGVLIQVELIALVTQVVCGTLVYVVMLLVLKDSFVCGFALKRIREKYVKRNKL